MKESFRVSRILQCQKALILFMHTYRWEFTHQPETLKKCKSDYMPSWLQILKGPSSTLRAKSKHLILGSQACIVCVPDLQENSLYSFNRPTLFPLSFCTACFLSEILTICLKHSFSPWALLAGLNPKCSLSTKMMVFHFSLTCWSHSIERCYPLTLTSSV